MNKHVEKLVGDFNIAIRDLIIILEKRVRTQAEINVVERAKARLAFVKSTIGSDYPIKSSTPFLLQYNDKITSRDEGFFTSLDIRSEIQAKKKPGEQLDQGDIMMIDLTTIVQSVYVTSPAHVKDNAYNLLKQLSICALDYAIAMTPPTAK
jgi:hypothetical protein